MGRAKDALLFGGCGSTSRGTHLGSARIGRQPAPPSCEAGRPAPYKDPKASKLSIPMRIPSSPQASAQVARLDAGLRLSFGRRAGPSRLPVVVCDCGSLSGRGRSSTRRGFAFVAHLQFFRRRRMASRCSSKLRVNVWLPLPSAKKNRYWVSSGFKTASSAAWPGLAIGPGGSPACL